MELFIINIQNFYTVQLITDGAWRDTRTIARRLGLTFPRYLNILKEHGANENNRYDFSNREDAERCVQYLEPYLIMSKLTGDELPIGNLWEE